MIDALGACNGSHNVRVPRLSFSEQRFIGYDHRIARGKHWIAENNRAVVQIRTGYIFQHDLEGVVLMVSPVSADESVLGPVEIVEDAHVQGEPRPQDRGDNRLLCELLGDGDGQGSGGLLLDVVEAFTDLIREDLPYPLEVAPEAHAVLLNLCIADLSDELVKDGTL